MPFTLDKIVPWGRSFDEYVRMFDLTEDDLKLRILGCADGPASFNSEMKRRGLRAVSVDPIYQFDAQQVEKRIAETCDEVIERTRKNKEKFVWDVIRSVEELGRVRMSAMREFLRDYEEGKREGRYIAASLEALPFANGQFDLALCSHFLFLYTEQLSLDFHRQAIAEMCRVAREARVFPLLDLGGSPSFYVDSVMDRLRRNGYFVEIQDVPYEFQRGGNQMMRVWTV